jgi:hypothetical protein
MQRVGAKKSKGGRPKKNPDTVSEFPSTLPAVAKTLGLDERTARRHVQAAAPEQQARVDAGEFGRWFSDHEQPTRRMPRVRRSPPGMTLDSPARIGPHFAS